MATRTGGSGILAMAATAFLWSIAGLFIKVIDWHPADDRRLPQPDRLRASSCSI